MTNLTRKKPMTHNIDRNMYVIKYADRIVTYARIGGAVSVYSVDYK